MITTLQILLGFKRKHLVIVALLSFALPAHAEEDGEELLGFMQQRTTRDIAMRHIDDVRNKWNDTAFCLTGDDPGSAAFEAVRSYLEANPGERHRPRRYLIVQGLRAAYPCPAN